MTAETIARALGGRKVGRGWMACCPVHGDREPSLSIRDADGKVLVLHPAGCNLEEHKAQEARLRDPGHRAPPGSAWRPS
jgi:hypothetical protein